MRLCSCLFVIHGVMVAMFGWICVCTFSDFPQNKPGEFHSVSPAFPSLLLRSSPFPSTSLLERWTSRRQTPQRMASSANREIAMASLHNEISVSSAQGSSSPDLLEKYRSLKRRFHELEEVSGMLRNFFCCSAIIVGRRY